MLEIMEEIDFEDEVLLIHPDEDIRKIEETDTNSNLEEASDSYMRKIEALETDTNSNLEEASDCITKIETIEIDTNSNLDEASDSYIRKIEAMETDTNSNLDQTFDSDSGEIDDDEEANDLEEGEIKDSSPVSKKKSDIACRFFKRGSCAYGSQCQYLHVSDSVYKMFETKPQKRNDMPLVEHHSFPKPLIFPPIVLPPRPFIEPPISVALKTDFHRQCDTFEDTWEKGLEQARILIRKANLKKKNEECEQKKLNSKNTKDEKIKGQCLKKSDLGNELDFNNKKDSEKNSTNSSFRKENAYDEKKSNYRYQPKSNDKWVDPWRRSKSPLTRKRPRSLSGSLPSHSRKHSSTSSSTSSVSSSSSEIDGIYRRPYEKKSPRGRQGFKSRSRSASQFRRPKKQKISPKRFSNGRRNLRSDSRSLSVSPYRKRNFSSCSQSRSSSSSSSCSDCQKSPIGDEDKEMKKISAKLSEQISQKSPKRASELLDSDCETSEMTVSSASCTSLSSDSEAESPHHSSSLKNKKSLNRNNASFYSNKTTSLSNRKVLNRNQSYLLKNQDQMQRKNDIVPTYQRKMLPSDNRKNLNNWSFKTEPTDYKPKNTASYFSSVKKSASAPKFSENKMSSDMELLSAYQRKMQPSDNSKNLNNWSFKTEPTDCKLKNTASYLSSVKKPASTPKASGNKMCSDMELLSAYQRKSPPSDNRKNINNWSFKTEPTDCKPKNTASCFSSVKKPASTPKFSENKLSGDMELLFMYQGLGSSNKSNSNVQKVKSVNPTSKPNRTKDAVNLTNEANGNSESYDNVSKVNNAPKKNIVLNLQPKCKDYFKPELFNKPRDLDEMMTIKKETASKREQLLNKLKLIDDAIARKKSK